MIGYCGLDCQKCGAFIATQKNDDALRATLTQVTTATASAMLFKRGYPFTFMLGATPIQRGARVCGRAVTLRFGPGRPDLAVSEADRNTKDPNIADVRTPVRIPRLERLGNWELVESPAPAPVAVEPAPVAVPVPTGWVPTPENPILVPPEMEPEPEPVVEAAGIGESMEPVEVPADEPEVEVVAAPVLMPRQPDPKAMWETYARALGVDPEGLTKAQLIAACRRAR